MKWFFLILPIIAANYCYAQDTVEKKKKWFLGGYVKNLESLTFDRNFKNGTSLFLLHNRFNVKWKPVDKFTTTAEFRNRLIWGEEVKNTPGFVKQLRNENESLDLQKAWIHSPYLVLHTNVERLNVEYRDDKWNLRAGRQRINWGVTSTWNCNDIFNTYNFLDFDYEERPGVDGARFQYIHGNSLTTEIVYVHNGKKHGNIAAAKFGLNKMGYDMQFITGWYANRFTLGTGWAGNIKDAGFKGEMQYFFRGRDSVSRFNLSLEGDYMFRNGWYTSGGLLFNRTGMSKWPGDLPLISFRLTPENLMPTKWSFIISTAKEITALLSARISIMYSPGTDLLIILPAVSYNLAENLDADLVWQSFFADMNNNFEALNHKGFLRLKWSF